MPDSHPQPPSTVTNRASQPAGAAWRGDTLWVHVRTGDSLSFANVHDEYAGVVIELLDTLPSGHFVVRAIYEDGIRVTVIDPKTGAVIELPAPPLPSPSGRLLVAGDEDALSEDFLTVWRLDLAGWRREYVAPNDPAHYWAPHSMHWVDDSTITLTRDFGDTTRVLLLQWRAGGWTLQPRP